MKKSVREQRLYHVWQAMIQRCENPKAQRYPNYGGRGIKVCRRWRYSFATFKADMGYPPKGHSIERKNNNRGYTPKNCCWASMARQNNNKSVCIFVRVGARRMSLADYCRHKNIPRSTYWTFVTRIQRGMKPEDAIRKPIGPYVRKYA